MRRIAGFIVIALLTCALSSAAGGQEPALAKGSLAGVVIRVGSNEPVAKAIVELRGPQGLTYNTGEDGRFAFPNLTPGSYRVIVRRDGFWPAEYGQRWVDGPGQAIPLASGQTRSGLSVVLTPGGAIVGRVSNRAGQPVAGARVRAMKPTIRENQRGLRVIKETLADDLGEYRLGELIPGRYYISVAVVDGTASGAAALVRDPDAPAGDQNPSRSAPRQVTARPPGNGLAPDETFSPIFFPATADSRDALPVDVDPGIEYRAADIFVYPIRAYHVQGVVLNLSALPGAQDLAAAGARGAAPAVPQFGAGRGGLGFGGGGLNVVRLAPLDPNGPTYATQVDTMTGAFDFPKVVPGSYVAYMFVSGLTVRASRTVDVLGGDVSGVFMDVSPGIEIPVRLQFDGEPPKGLPDVSNLNVALWRDPTLMNAPSIPLTPGEFPAIENLALGDYRVYVNPLLPPLNGTEPPTRNNWPNAYIKSIRLGDDDVLNGGLHLDGNSENVTRLLRQAQDAAAVSGAEAKPPELALEILVGANPGVIEGHVVNENREPVASVTVTLFADTVHNRILRTDMYRVTSTDASGRFEVTGLPPGEYKVFAWDGIERGAWLDPSYTETFESKGQSIHVEEGSAMTVDLSVIRVR
ncbi:MAG TPA: carboxypeptidase-like regulatory domain-containing protein [Terriglobia bacterium]|nr:carboxypeptidase-like regulatory domain-containing protein [Terriglobia bacterium]